MSDPFIDFVTSKSVSSRVALWSAAQEYRNSKEWTVCSLPDMPKTHAVSDKFDNKPKLRIKKKKR